MSFIFQNTILVLPKCLQCGLNLSLQESFQLCESQYFVEKRSLSSPQTSVILKIMGHLFYEKVIEKWSLLILENDHTSSFLYVSDRTGPLYPATILKNNQISYINHTVKDVLQEG